MKLSYTLLPGWLAKNWLFRKLFLIRKLFITRTTFRHHGQSGEDIYISRQFDKRYKGFFVDVGCFHPVKYNNTYTLYRRGWRGINIDINSIKIEGFRMRRPGDTNIQMAVSDSAGTVTFWTNGFYSLVNTLEKSFTEERPDFDYREETVQTDTLTHIIDSTKYRDRKIDVLTVDVEGHDLKVLESLDFKRYQPYLVAIEIQDPGFSKVRESALYRFLEQRDYEFVNWNGQTLMFKNTRDPRYNPA